MEAYQVDEIAPGAIPDITSMTNHELDIAMAYYRMGMEAGRSLGFDDGYRRAEADLAAVQRQAVASARAAANGPTYAQLAELRGEPERAERARQDEQRIMNAPPVGPARTASDPGNTANARNASNASTAAASQALHHGQAAEQATPVPGPAPPEVPMEIAALDRIRNLPGVGRRPDLRPIAARTPVHRPPPAHGASHGYSRSV